MNDLYQIADKWHTARYIDRKNRFVMLLELKGQKIEAYVPNTGRMTEFRFQNNLFYVAEKSSGKLDYRVISSKYQDNIVLLDTIRVNDIFHRLLKTGYIDEFLNFYDINREVSFDKSRFDFRLKRQNERNILIELKSCTLCHNGLAMFPDAPTARGRKHIQHLQSLSGRYEVYVYFLALTSNAEKFIPNFHIDYDYGKIFQDSKDVNYRAIKVDPVNPATIDLSSKKNIPIKYDFIKANCTKSGSYMLVLENQQNQTINVGALGPIDLRSGFYVYIGSAMRNLDKRVKRHYKSRKKQHWHIDYLTRGKMEIIADYKIRRKDHIESELAQKVNKISFSKVEKFGASDSVENSHLFYFKENPGKSEKFYTIVLNARTSLEV